MRQIVIQLVVFGALSVSGALAIRQWHPKAPPLYFFADEVKEGEIDLAQAKEWAEAGELVWVDARPRTKFDAGHIEGALLINEQDDFNLLLMDAWDTLQNNFDKRFVIYCGSETCGSSRRVAELLQDRGFPEVHVLHGGEKALREAGLLP
jgi:rhodanese-related sulfurtransferase